MTTRRSRIVAASIGLALLALVAVGIQLERLFEEPGATEVESIVAALGARSVLAVFAHPDDEVLVAALLADAARREGVTVRLVTATRGEIGYFDPPVSRREDLGLVRTAEVLKHGFALGLDEQEVWDFPDAEAFTQAELDAMREQIVARIRAWTPDLVVTFDPETGMTLHAQHRQVGLVATEAVRTAESGVGHLAYVVAPRRAWRLAGDWGRRVADGQPEPTHAMPAERRIKVRGWRLHASQQGLVRRMLGPSPGLFYRLHDQEHYAVAPVGG